MPGEARTHYPSSETVTPDDLRWKIIVHDLAVVIPDSDVETCREFANNSDISYWDDERNASKGWLDTFVGKLGEFAAFRAIRTIGIDCSEPDTAIYEPYEKSFQPDLHLLHRNRYMGISVKTFTERTRLWMDKKYSIGNNLTWSFQWANKTSGGGCDRLFSMQWSDEPVMCMFMPNVDDNNTFILQVSAPFHDLNKIMRPPLEKKLQRIKRCIYLYDLLDRLESKKALYAPLH